MTKGQSWNRDASSGLYLPKWLTNSLPPHLVSADHDAAGLDATGHASSASHDATDHASSASHDATDHSEQKVAGRSASSSSVKRAFAKLRRDSSTQEKPLRNPARSAVLVLLSGDAEAHQRPEDASVVLIHRATTLRKHAGQMAFPGGHIDPGDLDEVDTALREAEEETGLDRKTVTPMRVLDSIDISRTGFAVNPVLAYWHAPHPLRAVDPAETESVFNVPISHLTNPDNRMMLGYHGWTGPAFKVGDFVVWGFTGGVLSYLLDVAGWSEPWDDTNVQKLLPVLARSANGEKLSVLKGGRR
ncbi:CoA pyrophosphatase [Corynebacterium amycolatum]|uniref:CoA pyrophosphatase n=1 Tax=Corynebacterium amycolatum TaxID=43765 RepID=A0AAW9SRY5_CORAY|nr:CoA pyrophosphatase [Corynebacterium amycolatum]MDK7238308.1 CoA pyrophosphatase [Corynebacterium amycolatum]MDK7248306.1 CoA pyrophosphatase [Corynebacterium amycolatum]